MVKRAQRVVYQLVAARGYRQGWTVGQFMARQVAKLAEELGELAGAFVFPKRSRFGGNWLVQDWVLSLRGISRGARLAFDDKAAWDEARLDELERAKGELADLQVVVLTLAEELSRASREPFDVVEAAVEKARADVARGVRQGGSGAGNGTF